MSDMTDDQKEHCRALIKEAIALFGNGAKMARKLGVGNAAVINWKNGHSIPNYLNAAHIHKITKGKIRKQELRPDVNW